MDNLTPASKLSKALELHPDVLPYIISLNPHEFERLNNELMRRLMPPRITLARLANMVELSVEELINGIYAAAHKDKVVKIGTKLDLPTNESAPPSWYRGDVAEVVDLLASDEQLDTDPFVPIFPAIKRVSVGEIILLKHKWEPQPLYDVWEKLGVDHYAVQKSADEWWIYLRKGRESFRS